MCQERAYDGQQEGYAHGSQLYQRSSAFQPLTVPAKAHGSADVVGLVNNVKLHTTLSLPLVTFACRLHELLDQVDQGSQVVATDPIQIMEDVTVPRRDSDITAWVNVIYGCNERCTYCVVPNTRGHEQSRRPEHIKVGLQ